MIFLLFIIGQTGFFFFLNALNKTYSGLLYRLYQQLLFHTAEKVKYW